MIKNDGLENRVNAFRDGKNIPVPTNELEKSLIPDNKNNPSWYNLALYIIEFFLFCFKSFIYGYSLKILFSTNWNFISFICIGLSINFILESINNIFHK